MKTRFINAFSRFLLALSLVAMIVAACNAFAGKPTVVIASPPSGSQFREGEDVAVQSSSTDSSGIFRVELIVDDVIVRTDPSPSPQVSFILIQTWRATPGTHTLMVRAYNTANVASDPAAVSISVLPATGMPTPLAPVPTSPLMQTMTPAATSVGCTNDARFVADVTVPDGTTYAAGQTFDKTWRLSNNGTCAWSAAYRFVFVSGTAMTTNTIVNVPATAPGATADIKVPMTAPSTPGTYTGNWQLRSPTNVLFGQRVIVKIVVPGAPSGCTGTPNIASFTASPTSITAGGLTTLNWGIVTNAESAEIDQGIGGVETPGSRTANPATTTTYTLTARCGSNTKTAQVTITVNPPPAGCSGTPNITFFSAANPTIKVGSSTTLNWGAVTNADTVEIDQSIGGVATPGSASVSPSTTTTYTLTARCGGSVATRSVIINVTP